MPKKRYKMTDKRKQVDKLKADWPMRLRILILSNQGLNNAEIGRELKYSREFIRQMKKKITLTPEEIEEIIKDMQTMTVEEAEELSNQSK